MYHNQKDRKAERISHLLQARDKPSKSAPDTPSSFKSLSKSPIKTRSRCYTQSSKMTKMTGMGLVNIECVGDLLYKFAAESSIKCEYCDSCTNNLESSLWGGYVTIFVSCDCQSSGWRFKLAKPITIHYRASTKNKRKDTSSDTDGTDIDMASDADVDIPEETDDDDTDVDEPPADSNHNQHKDTGSISNDYTLYDKIEAKGDWRVGRSHDVVFASVASEQLNGLNHRAMMKRAGIGGGNYVNHRTFTRNRDHYQWVLDQLGRTSLADQRVAVKGGADEVDIDSSHDGAWDHKRNGRNHAFSVMAPVGDTMKIIAAGICSKGVNYYGSSTGLERQAAMHADAELAGEGIYYRSATMDGDSSAAVRIRNYNIKYKKSAESHRDKNHVIKNWEKGLDCKSKAKAHEVWEELKESDPTFTQDKYAKWSNHLKINLVLVLTEICDQYKNNDLPDSLEGFVYIFYIT